MGRTIVFQFSKGGYNLEDKVYARRASGLVRSLSAGDALLYNVLFMAPTAVLVYGVWALQLFPGVNLAVTPLIAIPISIIVGVFYAMFSAVMPRSGGDYVWVSRVVHPAVGFSINFFFFIVLLQVAGSYIPWFQSGLGSLLGIMGVPTAFVGTPGFGLLAAVVIYVVFGLVISRGAKFTSRVLLVLFGIILVGVIAYVASLLGSGADKFKAAYDLANGAGAYQAVIDAARASGTPTGFTVQATLLGLSMTFINFLGFNTSIYMSGEIKRVEKAQMVAIVGGIIVFGLVTWLVYQATYWGMGAAFLQAAAVTDKVNPSLAVSGLPNFLALLPYATSSRVLQGLATLGWTTMTLAAILTYVGICVRLVFAWSFDRVVPTGLSNVDRRTGVPIPALVVVAVVAIALQLVWVYTTLASYFAYIVFGWMVMQAVVAVAGLVLPRVKKDVFQAAPGFVQAKVGPVYWLQILAAATLVFSVWLGYASISPTMVGALDPKVLLFTFGIFAAGLVIYLVSDLYHRNRIPLALSFRELPPE